MSTGGGCCGLGGSGSSEGAEGPDPGDERPAALSCAGAWFCRRVSGEMLTLGFTRS